jgi:hypothetical protein
VHGQVEAELTDGSRGRYDLVIGADGLFSRMRSLLFPQAPAPQYTGQSAWRAQLPRPPEIDRRHFFLGGPYKVGLTPVSKDRMYMFLLENSPEKRRLPDASLPQELERLTRSYGGIIGDIGRSLTAENTIVQRPLEAFLLPGPWFRGRVLLIGDAAHPTTPSWPPALGWPPKMRWSWLKNWATAAISTAPCSATWHDAMNAACWWYRTRWRSADANRQAVPSPNRPSWLNNH